MTEIYHMHAHSSERTNKNTVIFKKSTYDSSSKEPNIATPQGGIGGCVILVRISIAVTKHKNQRHLQEERFYFFLELSGHTSALREARTELKA